MVRRVARSTASTEWVQADLFDLLAAEPSPEPVLRVHETPTTTVTAAPVAGDGRASEARRVLPVYDVRIVGAVSGEVLAAVERDTRAGLLPQDVVKRFHTGTRVLDQPVLAAGGERSHDGSADSRQSSSGQSRGVAGDTQFAVSGFADRAGQGRVGARVAGWLADADDNADRVGSRSGFSGDLGSSGGVDRTGVEATVRGAFDGASPAVSHVQPGGQRVAGSAVEQVHLVAGQSSGRATADDGGGRVAGSSSRDGQARPGALRAADGYAGRAASLGEPSGRGGGASGDDGRVALLGAGQRLSRRDGDGGTSGRGEFLASLDLQQARSAYERAEANLAALRLLQRLEPGTRLSDGERRTLQSYSGWGGCSDAFSGKPAWQAVNRELHNLLDEAEYAQARGSSLTAFYTPRAIVEAMWRQVERLLPKGETLHVLEPGCGTGNFIGSRPSGTRMVGVELDQVSAQIAQRLHDDAQIVNADIARTLIPAGSFDAVVGNVPYSGDISYDYRLLDGSSARLPLHDYCVARSVDALRPGGVAVLLTSRFTFDKQDSRLREDLARKSQLLGAVRLPSSTFNAQAGTRAVTDVLVLQKRETVLDKVPDVPWVGTTLLSDDRLNVARVNRLFAQGKASHVVGDMRVSAGRYGGGEVDVRYDGGLEQVGAQLGDLLEQQVTGVLRLGARAHEPVVSVKPYDFQPYEYMVDERGVVWYGDRELVEPVAYGDEDRVARLRGMVQVRDAALNVQRLELDPASRDEQVDAARAALNRTYDTFVSQFGPVSAKENWRLYETGEAYSHVMRALEQRDASGKVVGKADVFTMRTIRPRAAIPERVESATDAIAVSMDRLGRLDEELIVRLLDIEPGQVERALGEQAIRDPETGVLELADEYLSGDVVGKARRLRNMEAQRRARMTQAGLQAWQQQAGLTVALSEQSRTRGQAVIDALGAAGWACLVNGEAQASYMDPQWVVSKQLKYGVDSTVMLALASRILDELPPSVQRYQPIMTRDEHGTVRGVGLVWDTLLRQGVEHNPRAGSPLASREAILADVSCLVYQITHSDRLSRDEKKALLATQFSSMLVTDPHKHYGEVRVDTPFGAAVRALHPEGTSVEQLLDALVDEPALSEYVHEQIMTLKPRAGGYYADRQASYWVGRWSTLSVPVSVTDFQAFASRRAAFMSQYRHDSAAMLEPMIQEADRLAHVAERLEQVRPVALTSEQIVASLGAAWIPSQVVFEFMRDTFKLGSQVETPGMLAKCRVDYQPELGTWRVAGVSAKYVDAAISSKFGTRDFTPYQLLEKVLNNSQIQVFVDSDQTTASGKPKRVLDPQATVEAMSKADALRQAFTRWVFADKTREAWLTGLYNDRFNTIRGKSVDGSYLTLPGISQGVVLREHQRNAVARALRATEGTLLAHVVGAGKTFEGIAIVAESKRLGKASKPMVVVPNHLVDQWAADYVKLYPSSRILVMDKHATATPAAVRAFWGQVMTGDWDAVIVPQSRFSQLHMSRQRRVENMQERVDEYVTAARQAARAHGGHDPTVKRLEAARKSVEAHMTRLREGKESRDEQALHGMSFEQLGVDMLFVDEAHNFKNLGVPVAAADLGMSVTSAAKCEDLLDKCKYLRQTGHGSNIVFATGTPVSNSMSELYTMQRYLAPETLTSQGLDTFAAWAGTFGQVVPSVELKPEGDGFQVKQRFARFQNLPELMASVKQFTDVVTADDIDLGLPELEQIPVAVPITAEQRELMDSLAQRAERVRQGLVSADVDNLLRITGDGRKIALDPKLLKDGVEREPLQHGKVEQAAVNIARIWREQADRRGTQLVFCDASTPASGGWNMYDDLKVRLIAHGVQESEIAFVHDAGDNPAKREALFEQVRAGTVRVLVGSTQKLGVGTNVQTRLAAIHDLDCPWRPADLEQRLGRIVRQGNTYSRVQDYRYVTEGTFDAYSYQTVERKQRFIGQIMTSASPARQASDLDDDVVSLANIKALATGDPTIQERLMLENEVNQLTLLRQAHAQARAQAQHDIDTVYEPRLQRLERDLQALQADQPAAQRARQIHEQHQAQGQWEGITIGGEYITDKKTANRLLVQAAKQAAPGTVLATYNTVPVSVKETQEVGAHAARYFTIQLSHEHGAASTLPSPDATGPASALGQIYRIISQLTRDHTSLMAEIAQTRNAIRAAQAILDEPFARESEWREKTARLHEITQLAQPVKTSEKAAETDTPQDPPVTDHQARAEGVQLSHTVTQHDAQHGVNSVAYSEQCIQSGSRVAYQEHEWWVVGTGQRNGQPILELERETDNIIVPRVGASIYVDDEPVQVLDTPAVKPQWVCEAIAENSTLTQTRTPVEPREPQRHRVHCR